MSDAVPAIVGSAGFIGRSLAEHFRSIGDEPIAFTRGMPIIDEFGILSPRFSNVSTLYWLASSINPLLAESEPNRVAIDFQEFDLAISALERLDQPPRVVLASSGGTVYGQAGEPPYSESAETLPASAYGRAKVKLEERLLFGGSPLPFVVCRIANAYGPGQPVASGQGVIAHWLRAARRGEKLKIFGSPDASRDYIFIDDLSRALASIHSIGEDLPQILNIGSGTPTTIRRLADVVCGVVGYSSDDLETTPARSFDVSQSWLTVELASSSLSWSPKVSLEEGIRLAWDLVRATGDPQG